MSTITIPTAEITSEQVVEALRAGLDPRYEVQPGMRMPRSPLFGRPRPDKPELILVAAGPMVRAQVTIIRRSGHADIRVIPGGVLGDLLMNTFGIARKVRQALLDAPGLHARVR
jgi:hypothetical protein